LRRSSWQASRPTLPSAPKTVSPAALVPPPPSVTRAPRAKPVSPQQSACPAGRRKNDTWWTAQRPEALSLRHGFPQGGNPYAVSILQAHGVTQPQRGVTACIRLPDQLSPDAGVSAPYGVHSRSSTSFEVAEFRIHQPQPWRSSRRRSVVHDLWTGRQMSCSRRLLV